MFAPWLLLLIPFAASRIALRKTADRSAPIYLGPHFGANLVTELAMVAIFIYLYNLLVLSYCGPQKG